METMTKPTIGATVRINIQEPEGYTSDLYKSIQNMKGKIVKKQSSSLCYKDAWLIKFGKDAKDKYNKTHGGKWSGIKNRMEWWIESKDFSVYRPLLQKGE